MVEIDIEKINRDNFRSSLHALSQPGSVHTLIPLFDSTLQAMASVLLYTEVSYHYSGEQTFEMVTALTGAQKQPPDSADYVFADFPQAELLEKAKKGSTENPEFGATLLFQCEAVDEGISVKLSGPGIDGCVQTQLPVDSTFIDVFIDENSQFPTGIDLFFLDNNNRIVGLPRTTSIEVIS